MILPYSLLSIGFAPICPQFRGNCHVNHMLTQLFGKNQFVSVEQFPFLGTDKLNLGEIKGIASQALA